MKKPHNILVTGCGGDIGQSIGKILKSSTMFDKVIGTDLTDEHAAKFIFDHCLVVPRCKSPLYQDAIRRAVEEFAIDLILPASEPELRMLAEQNIEGTFLGRTLIAPNLTSMEVGFDKLATAEFLKSAGLPYPLTSIAGRLTTPFLPQVLKSRNGSGSKSVITINTLEDFEFYKKKHPDFVSQELVGDSEHEYTCGLFADSNGSMKSIILKRRLMGGFTITGEVVENDEILQLLAVVAKALKLRGSINVQLRTTPRGPLVFEINPRFSSTVMFRHLLGFEDVLWSVLDRTGETVPTFAPPKSGKKFYKGFIEYVD